MRTIVTLSLALAAALLSNNGSAQNQPTPMLWSAPPSELTFEPATGLPRPPNVDGYMGGRNSRIGDPHRFPATFFATAGLLQCTATLIGPQVLVTAAHCIADGGRIALGSGAAAPRGTCRNMKDGYPVEISRDYSFCRMDSPVNVPLYETIEFDPAELKSRPVLLGVGYGCTEPRTGAGVGTFRTGQLPVRVLPLEDARYPNFLITDPNQSFICPGDSGGAVYRLFGSQDSRRAIGIASSFSDQRPPGQDEGPVYSFIAVFSTPDGRTFSTEVLRDYNLPVCVRGLFGILLLQADRCR